MTAPVPGQLVIDAHQHVWDPARAEYPWLTPEVAQLNRSYDQRDIADDLLAAGVDATVLVQAGDNVEDTENMFRVAATDSRIVGVVAWVPLYDVRETERLLNAWFDEPVVGVRHLIHREADPDWMLRPDVAQGLELLAERGLTFDVCAESLPLLANIPALAAAHPDLRLVLDHLAKPPIRDRGWQPWADLFAAAAQVPTLTAKLSGLNTAAEPDWTSASFQPYVDFALEKFGPERLMYGGDWPFALLGATSYGQIHTGLMQTLQKLTDGEREMILGSTAQRIYRLSVGAP